MMARHQRWKYKWRRRRQGMPEHCYRINIGGRPGDVDRAAQRILAAVRADKQAMLAITVSSLAGPGTVWDNSDFCGRHRALGQRLAELDPAGQYKVLERVSPETAALLAGKPDEARRAVLGPLAALLPDAELDLPDLDLSGLDLTLDFSWFSQDKN